MLALAHNDTPAADYLNRLIQLGRSRFASDIHVVAGLPPALRINGEIVPAPGDALTREQVTILSHVMLDDRQKERLEQTRELCFSLWDDENGRIRVTIYFQAGVPELSIRLCMSMLPDAGTLGLPPVVHELPRRSQGLILVTGATGVGKSTTLAYMVDAVNRERRCKIVCIEDPVEFVHRPIRSIVVQQELHSDVLSFPQALTHALRQNPDIIVIGEMRELETIGTALTAAETGHLVMATLHTPNALQTVERIVGVFPAAQQRQVTMQVANSLQAVICQDLLARADGEGRVLAYEVLVTTPAVRNFIREGQIHKIENALVTGLREGMISMDRCITDLYQRAVITYDVAVTHMRDPKMLQMQ